MKKLPLLLLTLLGCSPDSSQQVQYYDTAVVSSAQYTEAKTVQETDFVPIYDGNANFKFVVPYDYNRKTKQRLAVSLSCRSHGYFEHVVTGDAADSMRESLKQGATVGVSCTPYKRLGYGAQIRHEILLKP